MRELPFVTVAEHSQLDPGTNGILFGVQIKDQKDAKFVPLGLGYDNLPHNGSNLQGREAWDLQW